MREIAMSGDVSFSVFGCVTCLATHGCPEKVIFLRSINSAWSLMKGIPTIAISDNSSIERKGI